MQVAKESWVKKFEKFQTAELTERIPSLNFKKLKAIQNNQRRWLKDDQV